MKKKRKTVKKTKKIKTYVNTELIEDVVLSFVGLVLVGYWLKKLIKKVFE